MRQIKPIVLVPAGCVEDAGIKAMRQAGYLVVVATDPAAVKILTPPPLVPLVGAAGIALGVMMDSGVSDPFLRDVFRKRLVAAVLAQENPKEK